MRCCSILAVPLRDWEEKEIVATEQGYLTIQRPERLEAIASRL